MIHSHSKKELQKRSGYIGSKNKITVQPQGTKKGYDITILEKHSTPGGRLNIIEQDGFRFDMGPSFMSMTYEFDDLFNVYVKDNNSAHRIISVLHPILMNFASGDLVIEIKDGNLLILRDEYFKSDDIESSIILAKNIQELEFS